MQDEVSEQLFAAVDIGNLAALSSFDEVERRMHGEVASAASGPRKYTSFLVSVRAGERGSGSRSTARPGDTLLLHAVRCRQNHVLEWLVREFGASLLQTPDSEGNPPLHVASASGDSSSVISLLHGGARLDARDSSGADALAVCGSQATSAEGRNGARLVQALLQTHLAGLVGERSASPTSLGRLLVGVLALATVLGLLFIVPHVAYVATGYTAKLVCSGVHLQGRTIESVLGAELRGEPVLRLIYVYPDEDSSRPAIHANFVLGMWHQTALYRRGLGCVLTHGRTDDELGRVPDALAFRAINADAVVEDDALGGCPALETTLDAGLNAPECDSRALVVMRASDGRVLAERYASHREPWLGRDTPLHGWSMAKSVLAALIGVRIGTGALSLNQTHLLPEWCASARDTRCGLSLSALLRMSSGLVFGEDYTPRGQATRMLFAEPDAARFAASSQLGGGEATFSYSSGTSNILSRVLAASFANAEDYLAFPQRALFDPLGIRSATVEADASGTLVLSSFAFASARDWARFGALFARDGLALDGTRLLPAGWAAFCATPAPRAPAGEYGAHWWLPVRSATARGAQDRFLPFSPVLAAEPDVLIASGYQGQSVTVLPARDLVVVRLGLTRVEAKWNLTRLLVDTLHAAAQCGLAGGG